MSRRPDQNKPRPIISGIVLISLGVFLLLTSHGYLDPEQGWPLLIIAVGAGIIATAFRRSRGSSSDTDPSWQGNPPPEYRPPSPPDSQSNQ